MQSKAHVETRTLIPKSLKGVRALRSRHTLGTGGTKLEDRSIQPKTVHWVQDRHTERELVIAEPNRFNGSDLGFEFTKDGKVLSYSHSEIRQMEITNVLGPDFSPET